MRYIVTILASIFLAAVVAMGASALGPTVSQAAAADGGYVKTCGGGRIYLDADEKRTVALHNEIRRNRDLKPFCVHPQLTRAARAHSEEMIRRDYFSHDSYSGRSFDKRVESFGYKNYRYLAENIAWGSGSLGEPEKIMDGWMHSDGHRHNILDRRFREIGVGAYTGTYEDSKDTTMYTADFGTRP